MADIKLEEIPAEEVPREDISMRQIRKKKKVEVRKYEIDKRDLSENIRKFDKRKKVYTGDPFSYNSVSLKRDAKAVPTAEQMISDALYNSVGKVLGIDTAKEWNQYYDKVYTIAEYAKKKAKGKELDFIRNLGRTVPTMGARRIDDIYIHLTLK